MPKKKTAGTLKKGKSSGINANEYEFSEAYVEPSSVHEAHTVQDLLRYLESGEAEIDAKVLHLTEDGLKYRHLDNAKSFLEAWKTGSKVSTHTLRESFSFDGSSFGGDSSGFGVGQEPIPLLGGPFFKQLYYTDYIKMINLCFYAVNHDPLARAIVNITRDFTLGRGYEIECKNPIAMIAWKAFEKVNKIEFQMEQLAGELSTYGETMIWKLPDNQTHIYQRLSTDEKIKTGVIPRVRLIDPSNIWDIVTWPEDITNVLYYVWVAPTQWQTYSGLSKEKVPTSKFIFQTIPAEEVLHYKVNSVSNEKRGRSDLFPVLGYLKRLRDSVNFQIISLQKQAAWSIDTTIEGSQEDIDAYVQEQSLLGTFAPPGSEFIHTAKIKREMLANSAGAGGKSEAFEWCLSMIAAGTGIPVNYFGTHLSGGQTRASALVATEPSAKKFEMRQRVYKKVLNDLWDYCMESFGIKDAEANIILPEIVIHDRTAKLKDMVLAQSAGWISKETAAPIAAKELHIDSFNFDKEKEEIKADPPPTNVAPLTSPGAAGSGSSQGTSPRSQNVDGEERARVSGNLGF